MHKNIILVGILAAHLCGCSENERLRLVAQDGNADAAYELALRYEKKAAAYSLKSSWEADKWMVIAADRGCSAARVRMGLKCISEEDLDEAVERPSLYENQLNAAKSWFEKAARQGDLTGSRLLGLACFALSKKSSYVIGDESLNRRDEVWKEGLYWCSRSWERVSEVGDTVGAVTLASTIAREYERKGMLSEAFLWRTRAAETGNDEAQFRLAQMYFKGRGCEKSTEKALSWLEKAAAQGHAEAKQLMDSLKPIGSLKKGGL